MYGIYTYICKNITCMNTSKEMTRFDTRISTNQKILFEKAASIGGYRSLTDFMILTMQQRAKEIIEENERLIVSKRDSKIFFDAISNPAEPNKELQLAAKNYKDQLAGK